MSAPQHEILSPGPLLNADGSLSTAGWSRPANAGLQPGKSQFLRIEIPPAAARKTLGLLRHLHPRSFLLLQPSRILATWA